MGAGIRVLDAFRMKRRIKKLGPVLYALEGDGARVRMPDGSCVSDTWRGRKALQNAGLCTPVADDLDYVEIGNDWRVR